MLMMLKVSILALFLASFVVAEEKSLRGGITEDPRTIVRKCEEKPDVAFLSQYKEDETIYEHFFKDPPKCGGTVVEIGGFDGKTFSNSWFYEYALGWRVVLIEAFPDNYKKMEKNRPDATNVYGAICYGESTQFQSGTLSATGGIIQDMSAGHKDRWTDETTDLLTVPCKIMSTILAESGISHVDAFFLDVEGGELTVLQTIDFEKVQIDMFVVEMDRSNIQKDEAVRALLKSKGYVNPPTINMLDECQTRSGSGCMPSELFVLTELWNRVAAQSVSNA